METRQFRITSFLLQEKNLKEENSSLNNIGNHYDILICDLKGVTPVFGSLFLFTVDVIKFYT